VMISLVVAQGGAVAASAGPATPDPDATNVEALGRVLYTDYVYIFQAAGIVLLIAMIGAIVLTLRHKPNIKRQDVSRQVGRDRNKAMEIKSVPTGAGVKPEDLV